LILAAPPFSPSSTPRRLSFLRRGLPLVFRPSNRLRQLAALAGGLRPVPHRPRASWFVKSEPTASPGLAHSDDSLPPARSRRRCAHPAAGAETCEQLSLAEQAPRRQSCACSPASAPTRQNPRLHRDDAQDRGRKPRPRHPRRHPLVAHLLGQFGSATSPGTSGARRSPGSSSRRRTARSASTPVRARSHPPPTSSRTKPGSWTASTVTTATQTSSVPERASTPSSSRRPASWPAALGSTRSRACHPGDYRRTRRGSRQCASRPRFLRSRPGRRCGGARRRSSTGADAAAEVYGAPCSGHGDQLGNPPQPHRPRGVNPGAGAATTTRSATADGSSIPADLRQLPRLPGRAAGDPGPGGAGQRLGGESELVLDLEAAVGHHLEAGLGARVARAIRMRDPSCSQERPCAGARSPARRPAARAPDAGTRRRCRFPDLPG